MFDWFDWGGSDDAGFEDQTSWNNDGDTSIGDDYTGYTPSYDNTNLDTGVDEYNWGGNDFSGNGNFYGDSPQFQAPQQQDSVSPALAQIFNNPNVKMAGTGMAALFEGYQNKRKSDAMKGLANNQALNPFGSQRDFYQQQARQAVTNPYDSPIVKAQISQLQRSQNIKDAAAGRRSNDMTSNPAIMAQMAQIAQNYQNQMAQQGGSNIAPTGLADIMKQGAISNVDGYISPMLAALSKMNTQNQMANIRR